MRFSFAVALRRVFDSRPPEHPARFYDGDRLLHPAGKGRGLYVFVDEPACRIRIQCPGYLPEDTPVRAGETVFVGLFPGLRYCAPPGFRVTAGTGTPGRTVCWPDDSCQLRLAAWEAQRNAARLAARPGIPGGMLLFAAPGRAQAALILEKEPPGRYYLSPLRWDPAGSAVRRIWAARADENGGYAAAAPEGFAFGERWSERGHGLWELEP